VIRLSRPKALLLAVVSLVAATTLSGCFLSGGDGGGGEDPQKVLEKVFSRDHNVDSGEFNATIKASAQAQGQSGSFDASLGGPFQSRGKGEFPAFEVTATASGEGGGQSLDFEGGLISTGESGFVSYQGTAYEIPQQLFGQFLEGFKQAQAESPDSGTVGPAGAECLKQAGIEPRDWLTNLENEGDTDVEGTPTTQISGDLDVARIVDDVPRIVDACGAGQIPSGSLDTAQLGPLADAVKEARFSVFAGNEDDTLRKLEAQVQVEPSGAEAQGLESLSLDFSLTLSHLNERQTIDAPSGAKPIEDLLRELGIPPEILSGGLGGLGGISGLGGLGDSSSGSGSATIPPSTGGGSAGTDSSQKYFECLQKAQSSSELQACASLLQ
jgi:hypothetical protein